MKSPKPRWYVISAFLGRLSGLVGILVLSAIGLLAVLSRRKRDVQASIKFADTIKNQMHEPLSLHPEIDPALCAGCGACVKVCPEGEILQLVSHKAVLIEPTKCVGHGQCEIACPFGAIQLVFGTKTRGMELPRISSNFETNIKGLYISGELGGMGLIRNAVKQGKLAAEHALKNLHRRGADYDVLIVGAGPAGFSAALACIQSKANYICIEQGSVGGTIFNFPRQKVVMTQPAILPIFGLMKFPSHKVSKEGLLALWNDIRKKTQMKIKENCKFTGLETAKEGFRVHTSQGSLTAEKVILAMGVRGTPRKLGLAGEDLPKVTYNLLDPEQYQGQHVAVIGGGNAAVEAAQYLCRPNLRNKVTLIVRGERFDRCNEENKRIINEYARQGLVKISWNSAVSAIDNKTIEVNVSGTIHKLANDFLFIFIGAQVPFEFLKSLGIKIEKKYGEALKKS